MIATATLDESTAKVLEEITGDAGRLESWLGAARRARRRHADCDANTFVLHTPREAAIEELASSLSSFIRLDDVDASHVDWEQLAGVLYDRLPAEQSGVAAALDRAGRALCALAAWLQPASQPDSTSLARGA